MPRARYASIHDAQPGSSLARKRFHFDRAALRGGPADPLTVATSSAAYGEVAILVKFLGQKIELRDLSANWSARTIRDSRSGRAGEVGRRAAQHMHDVTP